MDLRELVYFLTVVLGFVGMGVTYLVREARREEKIDAEFKRLSQDVENIKNGIKDEQTDHKKKHSELEKMTKNLENRIDKNDVVFAEIKSKIDHLESIMIEQGQQQKETSRILLDALMSNKSR